MATAVVMPRQGNSVEECLLVGWKKRQGEQVAQGEALAEIETDKASFTLEAPAAGVLLEIFVPEGQLAPVLTNVAAIGAAGESVESLRPAPRKSGKAAPAKSGAPARTATPAAVAATPIVAAAVPEASAAEPDGVSPRAREYARRRGVDLTGVAGSGVNGRVEEDDARRAFFAAPRKSCLARALTAASFEAGNRPGGGVNGLVLARDLRAPGEPLSGVRTIIASRMKESIFSTAQYTLNAAVDATKLLAVRKYLKANAGKPGAPDASVNDLVMFAVAAALKENPQVNSEFVGGKHYRSARVHLAFACDTPRGLLVPVIRDAHALGLGELAARIKELSRQAVAGSVNPDDLEGGTFTVSNLGSLGVESFTPVLNAPQVAILGVCKTVLRPVRTQCGVEFVDFLGLSLTCDHQVVDGAPGARFLNCVAEKLTTIDSLAAVAL